MWTARSNSNGSIVSDLVLRVESHEFACTELGKLFMEDKIKMAFLRGSQCFSLEKSRTIRYFDPHNIERDCKGVEEVEK